MSKLGLKNLWNGIREVVAGPVPHTIVAPAAESLDSDRAARNFGYLVILILFVGFGGWAALAPLESAARGIGVVQVEGNRKPVQHLEGGIVDEIMVSNGDYVTAGQPLIQLDATQVLAEQGIIQGRLWAKRANVDRLLSERDDSQEVIFSDELLNANHDRARTAETSERALFLARRASRLGEMAVIDQRIAQLEEQIEGNRQVLAARLSVRYSLEEEISDLQTLLEDGYVDKQRIRELERSLAFTLGEIADLKARIESVRVAAQEARLERAQLNKRFITLVVDELTEAQEEYFDLEHRYLAVTDRVQRSTIKAPASGYVMALEPNTSGAVVTPGTALLEVVPDVDRLVISVQMSPMDIDRLSVGQEAEVRFAVFKDSYTITGKLTKISADAMMNESTGQPFYEAKVELFEDDIALLGDEELVPGMPADVLVKTGSRTLLGYLTSPLQRMFENSLIED